MKDDASLSHTKWECKYHVVFIPKCRGRALYMGIAALFWGRIPVLGREGESNRTKASATRSSASARVYGKRKCNFAGSTFGCEGSGRLRRGATSLSFAITSESRKQKASEAIKRLHHNHVRHMRHLLPQAKCRHAANWNAPFSANKAGVGTLLAPFLMR
jgi:hypothetical protein